MKRIFVLCIPVVTWILSLQTGFSQAPMAFSLKQAQEYAYENNYDLKNAANDVKIAQKKVKENTAIGLPQINGTIDYLDYIALPVSLVPGDFFGRPGEMVKIQFGTTYNMTLQGMLTQLIYSGQYLVGLQTAKAYLETAKQKMIRDKMDVRDLVTEAYIGYLIVEESSSILDSTYQTVVQMVNESKEVLKQGLIEDIDLDQMELNRSNLEAMLINTRSQKLIAYNYLKFVMGLKENQEIQLTDGLGFFLDQLGRDVLLNTAFDYNHNIDYTLLKKQEYMVLMQYKLSKTAYQPSLTGYLTATGNAQRNDWNFFNDKYPWYGTASWGLSLNIPIWSSGNRKYAVDQARLNVDKMKVADEKTKVALQLQVETTKKDFNNYYLVFLNKQKGLSTARKIYDKTVLKYKQGIASSTDLNQKYNQFLMSESDYIQSLYDLLKSRIRLAKLLEQV